jgi:hypothetical protein
MGAKSNASTTGKTVQDSKPTSFLGWKCPHCSLTNEEDITIDVFGDTAVAKKTCIYVETCIFHQVMETHLQIINY